MIKSVSKGDDIKLSPHLSHNEFKCKCALSSCKETKYSEELMKCFEKIRSLCGDRPLKVNSGFRCVEHNKAESGKTNSRHLLGLAIDIACPSHLKYDDFIKLAKSSGFDVVVEYRDLNFAHCHLNP